jgi:predicted TIM-barrel fold metal-dependent hydrolase
MAELNFTVTDCDGHILESISEMAEFMETGPKDHALRTYRNREGVFPSLDGLHGPNSAIRAGAKKHTRVTASEFRPGSGEDWCAFIDKAGIATSVLFTSEGLSVGFIQVPAYAVSICRAYNDYVYEKFARLSPRLRPMALIPMQDVPAAVWELRRAVKELGFPGAMLPATGLPVHLGHQLYWPIYEEAEKLDCALAVHGGSARGLGLDSFTSMTAAHVLHHPVPLMMAVVSFIYDGVFDRFPALRLGLMEGGCGWLPCLLDRMKRNEGYYQHYNGPEHHPVDYVTSGRMLIGVEGSEETLSYLVRRVGAHVFAYASDYPHEVDFVAAEREIKEMAERNDLTRDEKEAILGGNAKRFYKLQ